MQTAYSYVRFSTPEQSKGDSLRRQMEASRSYAKAHGLTLDESLHPDSGISAYRGKNRTEGSLGAFLDLVKQGRIAKGSSLLVESLDRLSREEVEEALYQFLDIIRSGIEVHTLSDKAVYRKGALKTEQLIMSLFVMSRANEESARKSGLVADAWNQKQRNANGQSAMTPSVPGWLTAKTGQPIKIIPERAKVVQQIFKLAISGMGRRLIARRLNELGIPTFGKSKKWRDNYIQKILTSRYTLGEYQPLKKGQKNGPLNLDYYPAIITESQWQAAQASSRGKVAGPVGKCVNNLFTGLVWDDSHNRSMFFEDKGGRSITKLVTDCKCLGTKPNRISYPVFERAFLRFLDELDWTTVLGVRQSCEIDKLEKAKGDIVSDILAIEGRIKNAVNGLLDTPSPALKKKLMELEADLVTRQKQLQEAEESLLTEKNKHSALLDRAVVYQKLASARDIETRARLRQEIRRRVSKINLDFSHTKLHAVKSVEIEIQFVNGVRCHTIIELATGETLGRARFAE
jgi:DNA invertase Pin-like site-specific DNA recombinase